MRRPARCLCALALLVFSAGHALAATDVVLYATDATNVHGNWSLASDSSAAGGQLLSSADNGWGSTSSALASPADYFEFTFNAPAATAYHVWVRLRAGSNSKYSDSVYAQFSDAVDASGNGIFRIGTTSGLTLNLQSCNGCALSGWGWIDGGYWLSQANPLSFSGGGSHTLRIQTREDGVQLDQVVLSPATWLSSAPGAVTGDSTIVPKASSGSTAGASTPFYGSPFAIPGSIAMQDFDNGGEGVAYHDTTSGNTGGAYRSTDVDLEPASGGGYDVGWIDVGEWLNYTVNVASAGTYTVSFRVASYGQGGAFHLEMNGANVSGGLTIPDTGGWQNWQTVTGTVALSAGQQVARVVMDTPGAYAVGNIDSFSFVAATTPAPSGSGGATVTVPAGGDLQAAINAAQPGDTILLLPGVTYAGNFVLPVKSGSSYITIRSAAPDGSLPPDGARIGPQYVSQLPRVQGGFAGMPAFMTALGAHHYRLQFLEIVSSYAHNDIIELGDGSTAQNTAASVAHDLVVDRCYIHGDPTNGQKRGISLNSASTSIVNSYVSSIMSSQEDAQAIGGWNGPGPYTIANNYLEASGENVMFGGSDPAIANLVPSDITIRQNYITKQTAWRGGGWIVKNLIELKNAQRVVIDGNTIENCWAQSQLGFAFMLTPRNQNGTAPWSVVQHIQITNNIVRHVASAIDILATDGTSTYTVTNDVVVRNNLFTDVSKANWGGSGQLLLTQGGANIVFDHNTAFVDGSSTVYADVTTVSGFVFTNNIIPDNAWAIMGSNASEGNGTLAMYFPGATFLANVLVAGNGSLYPSGNYFPAAWSNVGFVNLSGGDYRLASTSPYYTAATDGTAIGCNVTALTVQ